MKELACESEVNWNRTDGVWVDVDGTEISIVRLSDARLHGIICWAVQSCKANHDHYASIIDRAFDQPARWLCQRALFVALVVELARRELSLPRPIFQFIESWLLPQLDQQPLAAPAGDAYRDSSLLAEQRYTLVRIQQAADGLVQQSQPARFIQLDNSFNRETDQH